MKTTINIQSVSDLITNSSSEVFVIYTKEGIRTLKDIVSQLLNKDFDKYFTVEIICNEYCWQTYEERPEDESDLSYEDWCFKHCEDWNDYDGAPAIENIKIVAKNPEDEKAARLINSIPYIFESESRYC